MNGQQNLASNLTAALATARHRLPYPEEVEEIVSPDVLGRLADAVMRPAAEADVLAFARAMPSRQLMLAFPLLAAQTQRSALTDRLNAIIRERACASLLRIGYVTFQRHYPHPLLPAAIVTVWQILRIRGIPYESILQDVVPLTSRSLPGRTARRVLEQRLPLRPFLADYRIDPGMAFGARLCALVFRSGDEAVYEESALLFEQVLLQLEPAEQANLVTHFLQLEKLSPPVFDQYCQIIYDRFGEPSEGQPLWDGIRPQERARFTTWVREATIGSHFRQNLEAARFFLRYRRYIRGVQPIGSDTLSIGFPGFTITHSQRWPDTAMYRSLAEQPQSSLPLRGETELSRDPGDRHTDISPADPRRPHRLPQEALRKSAVDGQVLLLLDTEGMKESAVFLEFVLRGSRRHFG